MKPGLLARLSARVRLVTWATGTRAAAPALVRQAVAVIAGGPPLGHEHALRAERGRRPDHRAEVARVGHPVQRDQQRRGRLLVARGDQVLERLVRERRHLQADALVQHAAGHPVQLGPADLQDRRCPGRRPSGRSR